jgi:N-methylhydantoinase A
VHQGVFSAVGLMTADMRVDESVTANLRSDLLEAETVDATVQRIRVRALERLRNEGYDGSPLVEPTAELRYLGQNYSLRVPLPMSGGRVTSDDVARLLDNFHAEHRRRYGYDILDEVVEFVDFTVTAIGPKSDPQVPKLPPPDGDAHKGTRPVYFRGEGWIDSGVYDRDLLAPGASIDGPAVVEERMLTTLVLPGQTVTVDDYGNCLLRTTVGR